MILDHPKWVLFVLLGLLAFFSYHARDFHLDASADSLLLEGDKDLEQFRKVRLRYPSPDMLIATFSPKADLFEKQTLHRLKNISDAMVKLPDVAAVTSILDVPLLKSSNIPLSELADHIQTLETPGIDPQKARSELLTSPLYSQLLISSNADTAALLVSMREDSAFEQLHRSRNDLRTKQHRVGLSDAETRQLQQMEITHQSALTAENERRHKLVTDLRNIMAPYQQYATLHLGGVPMVTDDMMTFVKNDLVTFGAGVLIFLVIVLAYIFRKLRWIVLPLLSCTYASIFMIGLLGFANWNVTVISSNFLALMLIITISMNIHLIVRYKQLSKDGMLKEQHELVSMTVQKMVNPCLYTTLTTVIGFSSLVISGIKPVIDFGWMMSAGLAVSFLTSFLLLPSLLMLMGKVQEGSHEGRNFRLPEYLALLTEHQGRKILAISVLIAVISFAGITQLRVENSFINYFSKSTEIYQGLKLIDDKLGGTTPLEIILHLDDGQEPLTAEEIASMTPEELADERAYTKELASNPAYWFSPDKIDRIKAVHDYLDHLDAIGKVQSLADVIRVAEDLNGGKTFDSLELSVLYKRVPEKIKNAIINPYLSIKNNEVRIFMRILDSRKNLHRAELLAKIKHDLTTKLNFKSADVTVTGLLVLYNNMLQSLFKSQIKTLGVVMIGIAIMFLILFRSFLLAVIGIAPNLMGSLVVLGIMGWMKIPLDMMTITIASITIGIAVDNGIHYIYRFREEFAHNGDYIKTLHICHATIGTAVLYTTVTIIFGFSILILSNFIPTIYFGVLTALAMLIALLSALTLLPKLILLFKPFGQPQSV